MIWIIYFLEIKDTTGSISFEKEDVVIVGNVKGDVSVSEGSLIITNSANVVGSVDVFGDSLIIQGNIKGDVSGICNRIIISGNITGDVSLIGKYVKNEGHVNGDLSVIALNFEDKGNIKGEKIIISSRALPYLLKESEKKHQEEKKILSKIKIGEFIFILLIIALVIITFLISRVLIPKLFEKLYENPIRTIIVGVTFVLLFIPIILLLIISILGILLIPIYLVFCIALLLISLTFGLILIGRIISRNYTNDFKNMIIGISIIVTLFLLKFVSSYVPYLNILIPLIFYSFIFSITTIGLGSVLRLILKI